jgi:hypothetical protein
MSRGCRHLIPLPGVAGGRRSLRAGFALLALSAVAVSASGCSLVLHHRSQPAGPFLVSTRLPIVATSVVTGPAGTVSAVIARKLFGSAPVVIVTSAASRPALATAVKDARRVHAPILLAAHERGSAGVTVGRLVTREIKALKPRAVLDVGVAGSLLARKLPGIPVVTSVGQLPKTRGPASLGQVAVLVHRGDKDAAAIAARATARVAGARLIYVHGYDPRADPAAITALAAAKPARIIAIGARFGPASRLAARVAVAATGVQLPGRGQVLFPMHRLVALYGNPTSPALGALGQQDLAASIARVKALAALYRPLSRVPVIPTFEIIATVAQGTNEPEGGTYSYVTPEPELMSWVKGASAAGLYVVLDLQAGRASLLAQAQYYQKVLELPNVGLALDPEWKLGPSQLPLQQIGSVSAGEVNSVIDWLAGLTGRRHLPQKLLVLHQFRLSMITDEQAIDTHHDDLAIVIHMDGQGTPGEKQQTWDAVLGAAPHGVFFGWKNFFVKDHPMLTPSETMARTPQPFMISYQ